MDVCTRTHGWKPRSSLLAGRLCLLPALPPQMDNFYTLTVYEKGSEVVRLYATLLGKEGFRKGACCVA